MSESTCGAVGPGHDQQTVLRVAIELFNRQGYDATSMGDLARELGLTKSAIYHHVPSKEHLLERALDEALDELTAALDTVQADTSYSPEQRLRAAVRSSVVVLAEHLPAVTLLLRVRGNTPAEQSALARRRDIDHRLAEMVREAADAGAIRADIDPLLDQPAALRDGQLDDRVAARRPRRRGAGRHRHHAWPSTAWCAPRLRPDGSGLEAGGGRVARPVGVERAPGRVAQDDAVDGRAAA